MLDNRRRGKQYSNIRLEEDGMTKFGWQKKSANWTKLLKDRRFNKVNKIIEIKK
mgnify:CR=1 FL=1